MGPSIDIRGPDPLGDTVISTAVIRSLLASFPGHAINIHTRHPDLYRGLSESSHAFAIASHGMRIPSPSYDIDLSSYLFGRDVQNAKPHRHLLEYMFDAAQKEVTKIKPGVTLGRNFKPKINLAAEEVRRAKEQHDMLAQEKPLVWLQKKTSTIKKDWTETGWDSVCRAFPGVAFVDLSEGWYAPREACALTAQCVAGITLDTFLLHGAQAVGAKNVIALLISSRPEVVCYPGQTAIEEPTPEKVIAALGKLLAAKSAPRPGRRAQGPAP